jgi:hypothetical protein
VRLSSLALLMVIGCGGNPVEDCDNFPRTDCCTENAQCADFYDDPLFSICSRPNQEDGGVCSECGRDADCKAGWSCQVDNNGFGQCIDPSACYTGTPWPGLTSCD